MNTCRCSVCNRTNNIEVCNTNEDYVKGPFFDMEGGDIVCLDCYECVWQALDDFGRDDEKQLEFDFDDAKEAGDVKW